jgi:hypothetical protein
LSLIKRVANSFLGLSRSSIIINCQRPDDSFIRFKSAGESEKKATCAAENDAEQKSNTMMIIILIKLSMENALSANEK